ncbi:hypothetical protein CC78DRAFT_459377 [Lojkania enalia]|uniref:Arrestin C-terminal-like domain-containing protein n=1 Tax=Lojkania enalia TaxID=147567 RepID=A0A9P4N1Q1_9PLEO|nr:hypothetical protein CC78DRAFT_459377 [Didymosphaeria enalia]
MTSSPTRGPGRSLFARLKSPLSSKPRNFTEFYIQPDDPHRQYAPGDIISGSVIIKVIKPLRITHLVISLHGYAQVFKNPNSPGDAYRNYSTTVGSGKGRKGGSYFGNGFVSLFEDEAVLCGEGRLGEGVYHFNFELEFPSKGLPSSIDFERGTISYMLTCTLTRPTTISPITSCDTKVYLMDVIDIAPVPEPKPRVISLEPISRRARTKSVRRRPTITEIKHGSDNTDSTRNGRVSELNSVAEESDTPGSPAPSDVSFESQFSSGNGSGTEYGIRSVNTTTEGTTSINGSRTTFKGKIITATIDVLKGGFLRGDHIPIKISVNHTKHVRSLKGIIITLYRQARVDMHPALPVAPNSKGDKTKSEDYYPKSKTGLGGLSLSSAGSSHLFRKDLSQSFAPLFIDPRTLTAEVKCAVRVPDEAFPTISNVPGAMISFRYFVEVVVDIQGKLTGLDRIFPNTGLVSVGNTPVSGQNNDATGGMFSTWGGSFADTDSIRREKGVISCVFEVVIGTKDSERNGKKKKKQQQQQQQPQETERVSQEGVHEIPFGPGEESYPQDRYDQNYYGYDENGQYYDEYGYGDGYGDYYNNLAYQETDASQPPYVPPSNAQQEEGLSEKDRLRRAEARLLPSQPPGTGPSSLSTQPSIPPSAPILPEDDDPNPPYFPSEPSLSSSVAPHPTQSPTSDPNHAKPLPPLPPLSPAPGYFPPPSSSSAHVEPTDDKQELQRRRLELERSAPPDNPDGVAGPSAPTERMGGLPLAPSAPVLDEGDEGEGLPAYHR